MKIKIDVKKAIRCSEEWSLFVSFPYDEKAVGVIKALPVRFWDKDNKRWEVPFSRLSTILEKLSDNEFDLSGPVLAFSDVVPQMPSGFSFKTKPFEHQIDGFYYGLKKDRWLLGDEQGLGKTKQVIDIAVAKHLQEGFSHCLIICGVNGLKWNWMQEVATHSNESAYILGQRVKNGKLVVGSNEDKYVDMCRLEDIKDYFLITNVETLRSEKILSKIVDYCNNGNIGLVAVDEIHKCKNPTSQQGKALLKIKSKYRIAMTGTPLMNTPLDTYIILKWLGYENHSFYAFKNHYCVMGGYGGYEIMGYRNLDTLETQLRDVMLRRLKKDVLDLPEKTHIDEFVEMTPKQEQIYKEVTAEIKANIDQIKMANNPLAELIRMRQATGYTGILSSTIKESAKLDRMEELVDEAIENGKKVVIFSNWTQMTLPIYNRLAGKYHGTYITGEVDSDQRAEHVRRFQEDDDCKFVVGTIGAMGTGLTLTAGTVEIFMDEPWNRANKEQAEDRCHRVGTRENVTIYTLLCKGTIDERIHELVEQKGALSDAIIDGKINMDKTELLQYLIG